MSRLFVFPINDPKFAISYDAYSHHTTFHRLDLPPDQPVSSLTAAQMAPYLRDISPDQPMPPLTLAQMATYLRALCDDAHFKEVHLLDVVKSLRSELAELKSSSTKYVVHRDKRAFVAGLVMGGKIKSP